MIGIAECRIPLGVTPYESPPGDPLEHHAAGFAKILCSAVFITGLDVDFAAEAIGYFSAPYEPRKELTDRKVDHGNKAVHVTLPNGVVRTAKYYGDQGCVALPKGEDSVYFTPVEIEPNLPDPAVTPWPMGDVLPDDPLPPELDAEKVQAAVDAAFEPAEGLTAAFVVTWTGRLIGERYREGITMHTPLESWSMGKSLTATLMGILIHQGRVRALSACARSRMARGRRSTWRDPYRRHHAHVELPAIQEHGRVELERRGACDECCFAAGGRCRGSVGLGIGTWTLASH